jgi:hypothetical protein
MTMRFARTRVVFTTVLLLTTYGVGATFGQTRRELENRSGNTTIAVREVVRLPFAGLDMAPDAVAQVSALPDGGWGVSSGVVRGSCSSSTRTAGRRVGWGGRARVRGSWAGRCSAWRSGTSSG